MITCNAQLAWTVERERRPSFRLMLPCHQISQINRTFSIFDLLDSMYEISGHVATIKRFFKDSSLKWMICNR